MALNPVKVVRMLATAVFVAFVGIQFVPVSRANPPTTADLVAPDNVKAILKTACYDCHSNQTNWPWYSYVAPVSWLVSHDVMEGREHLNFSDWETMSPGEKAESAEESMEEINRLKMPLSKYLITHPQARLSTEQIQTLQTWASGFGGESGREREGRRGERRERGEGRERRERGERGEREEHEEHEER